MNETEKGLTPDDIHNAMAESVLEGGTSGSSQYDLGKMAEVLKRFSCMVHYEWETLVGRSDRRYVLYSRRSDGADTMTLTRGEQQAARELAEFLAACKAYVDLPYDEKVKMAERNERSRSIESVLPRADRIKEVSP